MAPSTAIRLVLVSGALALGCAAAPAHTDAAATARDAIADAAVDAGPRTGPKEPAEGADAAYQITARRWLMAGDALTPRDATFAVSVVAPPAVNTIRAWLDGVDAGALTRDASGTFRAAIAAPSAPGEHRVLFAADESATAFAARAVTVSAALYAVVSVDWDSANPPQANLTWMERLRTAHPRLRYSQFVGPYLFTDPATTAARKQELVAWITRQRALGDELGVHIHPRCSFVNTTSVRCKSTPSYAMPDGDPTGYTVVFASYTADEQTAMLRAASELMVQNGFARPTSFRAGGWTAQLSTLEALERAGYLVESSAFPPETIQASWGAYELGRWNLRNWTGITATSQPYHPSRTHLLSAEPPPTFPVLEVPDNGCLVDYMTGSVMIRVLNDNWPDGGALARPTVFQVGLHPESFASGYHARLNTALTEVDRHLYAADEGPIVYARLTELAPVWP